MTFLLRHNIVVTGEENIPKKGGALMCINHTGYVDFYFSGIPLLRAKRNPRYMAKQEIFRKPCRRPHHARTGPHSGGPHRRPRVHGHRHRHAEEGRDGCDLPRGHHVQLLRN
ncbi:MAG: 1-acyl-sn-glycerol-3-phosphate acyltransferase [Lawsonella clevelandensis]